MCSLVTGVQTCALPICSVEWAIEGNAGMKLYGAPNPAPNPRRVRIFLSEKGIDLPETTVKMMEREHQSEGQLARNRSEGRRVGRESVSKFRARGSPHNQTKQHNLGKLYKKPNNT